jgi:hypothetical protein
MGLFSRNNDRYEASSDSAECKHPNQTQHEHTHQNGSKSTVASCKDCGMEWS